MSNRIVTVLKSEQYFIRPSLVFFALTLIAAGVISIWGLFAPINSLLLAICIFASGLCLILVGITGIEETCLNPPKCPHCGQSTDY